MSELIKQQIKELKEYYGVKTNKELCIKLGIKTPNIDYWIRSGQIPYKYLRPLETKVVWKKENIEETNGIQEEEIKLKREDFANTILNREKTINTIKEKLESLTNLQLLDIVEKIYDVKVMD